ncbi:MAG: DUF2240 family protein [Candidatus Odinarchaeia archaeon]
MENELAEIVVLPFKSRNKLAISKLDFIFSLSFDIGLYPPSLSERILRKAVDLNYLSEKDELIRPSIRILNSVYSFFKT